MLIYYECLICSCTCINVCVSVFYQLMMLAGLYQVQSLPVRSELSTTRHLRSTLRRAVTGWFQPFNKQFYPQITCSYPYSNLTPISFKPILRTNHHLSNTHVALLSSLLSVLCLLFFKQGCSQISERQECALMNKTRLLDSYVWREIEKERGRGEFPGVMKLNLPLFLLSPPAQSL